MPKTILVFIVLVLIVMAVPARAESPVVVVGERWMPFSGRPDSRREGYAVEILRGVFKREGIRVDYRERPWKRAVEDVQLGKADLIIGANRDELPDFIFTKSTIGVMDMCFYTNREDWKYTGPESLGAVKTGFVEGHGYRDWFLKDARSNPQRFTPLHGDDAFPRLMGMLEQGRIQALPGNQAVVNYYIKTRKSESPIYLAGCVDDAPKGLYYALSPADAERSRRLAAIIDQGIATMRKTGQLNHLLIKYGLKDWISVRR